MKLAISRDLNIPLWRITLPLLVVANLSYFMHNWLGWAITLCFFLIIPGNLLLHRLKPGHLSHGERFSLSVGLSLSIFTFGGLLLNSLYFIGLNRPLTTIHIFTIFDTITLLLILFTNKRRFIFELHRPHFGIEQIIVFIVCTLLPLITIGGANRLNNGASNILIMVVMASIAVLFIVLPARPKLHKLYPYAIFTIGLSILFCNSLRGWGITGHDIHHEFIVFNKTYLHGLWLQTTSSGDPYNACLSITILPTLIAKLTTITPIYVYKVVFQIIFATLLPTLFYMFRRFTNEQRAVLGTLVFMTFPTFTNDLPFLNRQEIAFGFIILLLFVNFLDIVYRVKVSLTIIFLLSIIVSHYSSSYVTLVLLLISPIFYKFLSRRSRTKEPAIFPLLNIQIILIALLLTFIWNAQITGSTGNLKNTIVNTFINLAGPESQRQGFKYSFTQAPTSDKPQKIIAAYLASEPNSITIIPKFEMPVTKFGHFISGITDIHQATKINIFVHAMIAKILQALVIFGLILMLVKKMYRKSSNIKYLVALSCASLFTLLLFTVLPQIAVDYDVTRLFQQSLMFLWLPSILFAEFLMFFTKRMKLIFSAGLYAFLYLYLAGFIPQITGGFSPQLPLNNAGVYYDFFYSHNADIVSTKWLAKNRDATKEINFDSGAIVPIVPFSYGLGFVKSDKTGYQYLDFTDTSTHTFRTIIDGVFVEYTKKGYFEDRNKIYSSQYSQIYLKD